MKILTGSQMQAVDKKAIEEYKIPSLELMENAGKAVYEEIIDFIEENGILDPTITVTCGSGNNGGDGYVIARLFTDAGFNVTTISICPKEKIKFDALSNFEKLEKISTILFYETIGDEKFQKYLKNTDILIDAILGTGLKSEVTGTARTAIENINKYFEGELFSVDIPSGIDADNAKVHGEAIIASSTVSFQNPKVGNILYPAADYNGEVIVADIGIPSQLTQDSNLNLITSEDIKKLIPKRAQNSHKGSFGKVLNIAGSFNYQGAGYLSSMASLKVGAGYTTLATPSSLVKNYSSMTPDFVYLPLNETENKAISVNALETIEKNAANYDVLSIGCGLGQNESTVAFIKALTDFLFKTSIPCIFDADALTCLAYFEDFKLPQNSIITPHPKELSRLLNIEIELINEDRIKYAQIAAEKFNCIVLLKGARSIIAEPKGQIYINPTGCSALAKAGTGDVLTGMIAGFCAQNKNLLNSAIIAAYIHGVLGELASAELSEYSVLASDLLKYIPDAMREFAAM